MITHIMSMVNVNKGRIPTLTLTLLCQATQAVALTGLPLLLPYLRDDLGLTFAQAGSLASASLLVYAVMQIPAGYLADRYSPLKMVVIGTLGLMGISMLLAVCQHYWQVLGIQFLWGFFSSFIFTPAMSIFIRWFPPQRRSTATAIPSIGPGIGIFAINLLFPIIYNQYDSWRLPFIIAGITGIILALALLIAGKEKPSQSKPTRFRWDIIKEIFGYKKVWMCYGLQFIRFSIVQGLGFWLPTLLIVEKQFPLQLAGAIIALQAVISSPANIFGGYISDRINKPTLIIGISMLMLGITTGLMVNLDSMIMIIAVIVINAVFLQAYFGPLFTMAVEILGPEKTGLSNGVSNMFAIVGGLVTAQLMGILRDTTGSFEWGFYTICGLSTVGLVLTLIMANMRLKKHMTDVRRRKI